MSDAVVIPLRLSALRYGLASGVLGALSVAMAYFSVQPTIFGERMDAKARMIARLLMLVDPVAGVWPLVAAWAAAFAAGALFLAWALVPRRAFELTMDSAGVRLPSLAPWRAPRTLAWSDITSVARNAVGDYLVFTTKTRRILLPAWWLPSHTSAVDVVRIAEGLRANRAPAGG
jgi:hypothetical protein